MRSLKYRAWTKLMRLFGPSKPAGFSGDDFDWRAYSAHYADELKEVERDYTTRLSPGDYEFQEGSLTRRSPGKPLHPNHRLLYETLLQLGPASVREMGCGAGDHLYNLSVLAPQVRAAGVDRSRDQLRMLERRSPGLKADVSVADITQPLPDSVAAVDIAYTQAVIMHINTGDNHLTALCNLFHAATKQVVLVENWSQHPFLEDIRRLHAQGRIPWKELHFYFRRAPELADRPHLMVVSLAALDYEPLEDYDVLLSGAR